MITRTVSNFKSISIIGPTASGKTGRAVSVAKALDGEIISADSRQVYKEMDLGTGKDLEEYGSVKFHLIDICDPGEKYNLHRYLSDFQRAYVDIISRNKYPVICGGTGLYVESALSGLSLPEVPENRELRESLKNKSIEELTVILKQFKTLHNTTDIDTEKRAIRAIEIEEFYKHHPDISLQTDRKKCEPLNSLIIGLDIPREERRKRITNRLDARLEAGMVDEVRKILEKGVNPDDLIYYGLEYKFLTLHVIGKLSYDEMKSSLEIAIHQFAKRQMTWFRGMERRGFRINWLPFDMEDEKFISSVVSMMGNN